ncbi:MULTISPECIES: NRDE family protein [Emticicia]|uniref:NRDE family protein n=1 Tax=Emticicia TaxID=312278 RepID=UPI0007D8BDBE|nr:MULTISPECIES: NRDE family protein [Emticicia]
MCVLTYIPTKNNGFILTSNRDEAVSREPAIPPRKYNLHGQNVFFPKDPKGGGTWIASSGEITLCLLNGGIEKHISKPPYRQSRGKVVLDYFEYQNINDFVNRYFFEGIEPFTLIVIENNQEINIHELRWSGERIYLSQIDNTKPRIWSSVTLYSPQIIKQREEWFKYYSSLEKEPNSLSILDFHHTGGSTDSRNAIKMNRDDTLKTISITQFIINEFDFTISYQDLQAKTTFMYRVFRELTS